MIRFWTTSWAPRTLLLAMMFWAVLCTSPNPVIGQQPCDASFGAGPGFPTSHPPFGNNRGLASRIGTVFSLGLDCGSGFTLGGNVELSYTDERRFLHFLFGVGWTLRLNQRESTPWLRVSGRIGPFLSRDRGRPFLVDGSRGEAIVTDDEGLAYGAGVRVGFPVGGPWSVFFDGSARASSIRTIIPGNPDIEAGDFTEVRLPITFGLSLRI